MAWVNWSRKSQDAGPARGPLGIDLNAGRARAARNKSSKNRIFPLAEPHNDLVLDISMENRSPLMGPAARGVSRKLPHVVCSEYLAFLRQAKEWKHARHSFTPETATAYALERLRTASGTPDRISLALPSYLSVSQVSTLANLADKAKLRIRGTATVPLALAAERATHFLFGPREDAAESARGRAIPTTSVLIVDADDHATTASIVRITEEEVRSLASATFPRLSVRMWRERLLDALSDRCVRLCRRDPRDSAETEQMLFDQIDDAMDRARGSQQISLNIRSTQWYQDLIHAPADLAAFCSPLCRAAGEEAKNLLSTIQDVEPPRAVWLTHDAGRLPGLAAALHHGMPEGTSVRILHPEAAAGAVANLLDRWDAGELPRTHLDTTISLPPRQESRVSSGTTRPQPTRR